MQYTEYLKIRGERYRKYMDSDEWKLRREKIFIVRGKKCEKCKSENNLHVHHSSYKKLGNEPDEHLHVLCGTCHMGFHEKYNMGESMLNKTMNYIYGKGWRKRKRDSMQK